MSSQPSLTAATPRIPVVGCSVSLNRESMFLNGELSRWLGRCGEELLAGVRIVAALLLAVAAEWHFAPLGFAGGAPLPLLASVVACYALTSSFGRLSFACVVAGVLRDAHSPGMPFGASGLIFLLVAAGVREICDRRGRCTPSEELVAGMLLAGGITLLGHGVLLSTSLQGTVEAGVLPRRVIVSAFAAGLAFVPLLRVAKVLAGRLIRWSAVLACGLAALLASWMMQRFNVPSRGLPALPERPMAA